VPGTVRAAREKVLTEAQRHREERQRERDAVRLRSEWARRRLDGDSRAHSIAVGKAVVKRLGYFERLNSLRASVAP
jgi:hypothetical protein